MRARTALLYALVAALAYAAFAHGAARQPGEAWLEIALAALALWAASSALLGGAVRASAARPAWWGVALLAGFAAWSGLTLAWSIAPDRTWEELNRAISYALVAGVAVAIGATVPRAVERFALGWLAVASAVALYALGTKVVPGLHVGPLNLDEGIAVARLRQPLEYWNALALVCVLGAPVAVRLATDAGRSRNVRLLGVEALYLLVLVIGMTYSRGGVLALAVAAVVLTAAGGARLRGLVALALALAAAAVPLAVDFTRPGLKASGEPLGFRIHEGRILGVWVVLFALLLAGAGAWLVRLGPRVRWSAARSRLVWRALGAAAALALVVVVAAAHASISHAVRDFTAVKQDKVVDPVRLLSTNSGNRWVWWKEAGGAWSDRPIGGWGAGSFALLHQRYRRQPLPVTQAHSVPMQILAETGVVGLLLAYGGLLALLAAAIARARALPPGRQRDLAVALLAGVAAWLVHAFVDWDWNIPAVTAPMLAMLGVVAARPAGEPTAAEPSAGRAALVAAAALAAVAAVISAGLPAWADAKADAAARDAARGTPAALRSAAAEADLAARLDPFATRPLFVAAAVAQARHRLLEARDDLLRAVDREPNDPAAWTRLAGIALQLADREGFVDAAQRALELDPANPLAAVLAYRARAFAAPPASSATAVGTPLPPG